MESQLNKEDRAKLRVFLSTYFTLEELKDLAFDQVIPHEADVKHHQLAREIIEASERKQSLSCLIKDVISRRSNIATSELGKMLAQLPPCKKRAKVQLILHGIDKELPPEILAKIAEWAGTPPDDVELIAAASGSMHVLISLSEARAGALIESQRNRLMSGRYRVKSIKSFEALNPLAQIAWRVLVLYTPFSGLGLLEVGLSWEELIDVLKRGQAVTADTQPEIHQSALFNYYGGLILLRVKNWERAVLNFSRSLDIMPHFAEANLRRGIAYYHLGQYEMALADYNAAIKYGPGLVEAYNHRGALFAKLGKYDKALADFSHALQLDPGSSISYTNHGSVLYHSHLYKDALSDFDRAIRFDPSNQRAYVCRGFTLAELGRYREALADFNKAAELAPDDAQTYVHRGIIRERLGHNEEARHDFQHALIVDPNNKRAHRIMLELNAADESPSIYLEIVSRRNEADNYFEKRTATASSSVGDDYSVEISDDLDMEA